MTVIQFQQLHMKEKTHNKLHRTLLLLVWHLSLLNKCSIIARNSFLLTIQKSTNRFRWSKITVCVIPFQKRENPPLSSIIFWFIPETFWPTLVDNFLAININGSLLQQLTIRANLRVTLINYFSIGILRFLQSYQPLTCQESYV